MDLEIAFSVSLLKAKGHAIQYVVVVGKRKAKRSPFFEFPKLHVCLRRPPISRKKGKKVAEAEKNTDTFRKNIMQHC